MSRLRRLASRFDRREPVHFLHVSKTGGTAVRHALEGISGTRELRFEMHTHHVTLATLPPGERAVLFVRDTVDRYASAFLSRQRRGRPRFDLEWTPDERRAFERFATPNELAEALSSADAEERAAAEEAMASISQLRFPLSDWLGEPEEFARGDRPMFVGFQETLPTDFAVLCTLLGVEGDLSLPDDDVAAHRTPDGYDAAVGDLGAANIRAWYGSDAELLEECRRRRECCLANGTWDVPSRHAG